MDRTPTNFYIAMLTCAAVLSGCDSGGGKGSDTDVPDIPDPAPTLPMVTVSGVVEKGPFQQMQVNAWGMDGSGQRTPLPAEVNGNGYSVSAPEGNIVYLEATGSFTNELNGESQQLNQPLRAITPADGQPQNINLFTDLAAQWSLGQSESPDAGMLKQGEQETMRLLGLSPDTDPGQLGFSNIKEGAGLNDPSVQLLLFSAFVLSKQGGFPNGGLGQTFDNFKETFGPVKGNPEGTPPLDFFGGMDPQWLLDAIITAGVLGDLPPLELGEVPVLVCNPLCKWFDPETPSISLSGTTVYESDGSAILELSRTGTDLGDIDVTLEITSADALPGEDYLSPAMTLTFAGTERTLDIPLELIIDTQAESDEVITVDILEATDAGGNKVTLGQSTANITIKDGAPALAGTAIAPTSLCLVDTGQGDDLPADTSFSDPLADACHTTTDPQLLLADKLPLLRLGVGLKDACSSGCSDQLLDLELTATADDGSVESVALGQFRFPATSITSFGEVAELPIVALNNSDAIELLINAAANDEAIDIKATSASDSTLEVSAASPVILPLPTDVNFGDRTLSFDAPENDSALTCPAGSIAIRDNYAYTLSSAAPEATIGVSGSACIDIATLSGNTSATVTDADIDLGTWVSELPEWHFMQLDVLNGSPAGDQLASSASPLFIWDFNALQPSITVTTYLGAEHLPFLYAISDARLTEQGLELLYSDTRLRSQAGFASNDPRANAGFSNLSPYIDGQSGTLLLTVDGITASTTFNARGAVSAYPLGVVEWGGFTADVTNGQLAPTEAYVEYALAGQTKGCADLSCTANGSNSYAMSAATATISAQGIVATGGTLTNDATLSWGGNSAGSAWSSADATLSGYNVTLNLPGNAPAGMDVAAEALQAHRTETTVAAPGSDDFVRGNQYPPGLTFGPEQYANAVDGQPVAGSGALLAGTDLTLTTASGNVSFDSSVATKWVVRNDGVTGVYNAEPSTLPVDATLQGYDFTFDRFAIRTRMNEVDEYNWVDGGLVLRGDAGGDGADEGWEINFTNQIIACNGELGRSVLAQEQCGGEICRLASWRADSTLIDMSFSSPASCASETQLIQLGLESQFLALDSPLMLSTTWNPDGTLAASEARSQDQYLLDKRDETEGFPVQITEANLISPMDLTSPETMRYGTVGIKGRVALPFWNALEAEGRLANTLSLAQPSAEPTVLVPEGIMSTLPTAKTEALNINLLSYLSETDSHDFTGRYEWGNTGFGFGLPVYYADTNNIEQATFLGRTWEKDLYVMDVNAGINFIEPVRTSLSFGASADFEKLREVRFQIELGKGEGLSKVDDLLITARIIDEPVIEPTFGIVNTQVERVNQFAGRGVDELLEKALLEALEQTGAAVGAALPTQEDPFDTLAGGLARLRSVPGEITNLLDERLFDPTKDAVEQVETQLRAPLRSTIEDIHHLTQTDPVPQSVYDQLDNAQAQLGMAISKIEQPFNHFDQLRTEVDGKVTEAQDIITKVEDARSEIALILTDVTDVVTAQCENTGTLGAEVNGYLESSLSSVGDLRTLAGLLQASDLLVVVADLAADDPQVRENLLSAQQKIQSAAEEITSRLDSAEEALRNNLCSSDINILLAEANNVLTQIGTATATINASIAQVTNALNRAEVAADTLETTLLKPLKEFKQTLDEAEQQLRTASSGSDGAALVALMDSIINDATSGELTCIVQHDDNLSCDDIFVKVTAPVTVEIDAFRDAAIAELEAAAAQHMPDVAYLNAEQLRGLLIAHIMNSQPVRDVREAVNTQLVEVMRQLQNALLTLTDKANEAVQVALQKVENEANDALDTALAPVKNIPLTSASLDGFATVAGNDLERLHIGAEWTMLPSTEGDPGNTFGAALDVVSWAANNKSASCGGGDNDSNLDVTISVLNVPANIGESELNLAKVYLGFTLDGPSPIGVAGGLRAEGEIKFTEFQIYDPAFAAGLGKEEIYLGAAAGAVFSAIQAEVAFLAGKTCNQEILMDLDPKVAQFIPLPDTGFTGAYVRGAASIPIYSNGCPLTIGAAADIGAWVLAGPPVTLGGLVGGGAYGKVGCVGALRGQIRALGQVNTDGDMVFVGEGFGVAGLGLCEPATWTSVERSRKDKLCGTGDAILRAGYMNGWSIMEMKVSAIH
jgi:hypothetical protein